jgi:hypothetical protein
MTMYEWTVVAATGIILALAVWVLLRRWSALRGGPFVDVPDAPSGSEEVDAPGVAGPYSSLDPWAPPKQPVDWSRTDRAPD